MKFFIIHGALGNPSENWFPWLKKELETLGHEVVIPAFPTPKNQSLATWMECITPYLKEIDHNVIFIGHSLGPAFILSLLEKIKVKACFFVAGFLSSLDNKQFDILNKTFIEKEFDWKKIKEHCKQFFIYHSDNDPYVPLKRGEELAQLVSSKLILSSKAGHFNTTAGYREFPQLLEDILKVIKL